MAGGPPHAPLRARGGRCAIRNTVPAGAGPRASTGAGQRATRQRRAERCGANSPSRPAVHATGRGVQVARSSPISSARGDFIAGLKSMSWSGTQGDVSHLALSALSSVVDTLQPAYRCRLEFYSGLGIYTWRDKQMFLCGSMIIFGKCRFRLRDVHHSTSGCRNHDICRSSARRRAPVNSQQFSLSVSFASTGCLMVRL